MGFVLAIAEDRVSTKAPDPYIDEVKWETQEEWTRTKRAPRHAAWMHEMEMAGSAT